MPALKNLALALVFSPVLALAGCGGNTQAPVAPTTDTLPAAGTTPSGSGSASGANYTQGDVLKHAPKDCRAGRIYVNLAEIARHPSIAQSASKLLDMALSEEGAKGVAVRTKMKDANFDLVHDLHEIAICGKTKHAATVLIGGDFGKVPKPIDTLFELTALAGKPGKKETFEGHEILVREGSDKAMVLVAPTVLAVVEDKATIASLMQAADGSAGFAAASGKIIYVHMTEDESVEFAVEARGENLEGNLTVTLPPELAKALRSDPKAATAQFQQKIGRIAGMLANGPFKNIAQDIEHTRIVIQNDGARFEATVPMTHVTEALQAAASMKPADLKRALRL